MNIRQMILDAADDTGVDFVAYDRTDDEDLPPGSIHAAIAAGEVTIDEIVGAFRRGVERELP